MRVREIRPGSSLPPVIKNLLIINGLVWLAQITIGNQGLVDMSGMFALHYVRSEYYKPWQFLTYMFMHDPGGPMHLLFNMFALWMFGSTLENLWGSKRFLLFYLICGLGAALVHMGALWYDVQRMTELVMAGERTTLDLYAVVNGTTLGASGAVMGIFAAFAYTFPNTQLFIIPIPFPIKAKWAMVGMIALDLFGGFSSRSSGVAHFAHVGGALVGILLLVIWNKRDRQGFY